MAISQRFWLFYVSTGALTVPLETLYARRVITKRPISDTSIIHKDPDFPVKKLNCFETNTQLMPKIRQQRFKQKFSLCHSKKKQYTLKVVENQQYTEEL